MDKLVRMIAKDAPVQAVAITGRGLVERARNIHDTTPLATAALGRALMGGAMMGNALKSDNGSITLHIKGDGPMGGVTVVADSMGNPRGYVRNSQVELPLNGAGKLDVGGAVGRGTLTVIKDAGLGGDPYVGVIPLTSGEIAEDITSYYAESEQIPTVCALGVLVEVDWSVRAAGGYIIQLLPGADDGVIDAIEAGVAALGPVTAALDGGCDGEGLLRQVLGAFDLELLEETEVEYRCDCNEDRVNRALISMGREELTKLIEEDHGAQITCQFCDKVYAFDEESLKKLLANS